MIWLSHRYPDSELLRIDEPDGITEFCLASQSHTPRTNAFSSFVAGRRFGDFRHSSPVRTHAQSCPQIESPPRAGSLYRRMRKFSFDSTAPRCAPVAGYTFPGRLRRCKAPSQDMRANTANRGNPSYDPAMRTPILLELLHHSPPRRYRSTPRFARMAYQTASVSACSITFRLRDTVVYDPPRSSPTTIKPRKSDYHILAFLRKLCSLTKWKDEAHAPSNL